MKILVLDSKGMVGHVIKTYFAEQHHDVVIFDDITDFSGLEKIIAQGFFDAVINCSAIINQDAEADKAEAVKVNALLPHFLESVTNDTNTVVVHRSTDCIFSGDKGNYTLADWPDATSFYARSKALGELINDKDITIRTSLIGPETDNNGTGLFNWFYHQSGEVNGFVNAIWTGLTTIEFAKEIEWLLVNKKHGLLQLVPEYPISKYELLLLFDKYYPGNRTVNRIDNKRVDKSLAPVCGGILVPDYQTQISEMRKWTDAHKDIYSYE